MMDYGEKILKEMTEEVKNMSINEYNKRYKEATLSAKKLLIYGGHLSDCLCNEVEYFEHVESKEKVHETEVPIGTGASEYKKIYHRCNCGWEYINNKLMGEVSDVSRSK